jgi:hypothetical protein
MMNTDFKTCTEEELWKYVAAHLKMLSPSQYATTRQLNVSSVILLTYAPPTQ